MRKLQIGESGLSVWPLWAHQIYFKLSLKFEFNLKSNTWESLIKIRERSVVWPLCEWTHPLSADPPILPIVRSGQAGARWKFWNWTYLTFENTQLFWVKTHTVEKSQMNDPLNSPDILRSRQAATRRKLLMTIMFKRMILSINDKYGLYCWQRYRYCISTDQQSSLGWHILLPLKIIPALNSQHQQPPYLAGNPTELLQLSCLCQSWTF